MSGFGKRYSAFDRFQQRHRWLGFPVAVLLKYADDQGGYLAATITYYAFFAMFLLILLLINVVGALACFVGVLVTLPLSYGAITAAYRDLVGFENKENF